MDEPKNETVAVADGHLYANPARDTPVRDAARRMFKVSRRERAERGPLQLQTRDQFVQLVEKIRATGVSECKAAANYVQFIAFSGARKTEAANVNWLDIDFDRGTIQSVLPKIANLALFR